MDMTLRRRQGAADEGLLRGLDVSESDDDGGGTAEGDVRVRGRDADGLKPGA